jgi:hypothetical protein
MAFNVGSVIAHIKADITGFQDGIKEAQKGADIFGDRIQGVASTLGTMTKVAAIAAVGAAAIFAKSSIEAAAEAQKEMAKFNTLLKNSKNPTDELRVAILKAADASVKLGFDDEETAMSIARFYQRTGDLNQSLMLNSVAMDLARDKNMDMVTAQQMVGLVLSGNGRALKQYGIILKDSATPLEAIIELQTKVKGSAEAYSQTYAGSIEIFNQEFTNLKETVGAVFLPSITQAATGIANVVSKIKEWEIQTRAIENAIKTVGDNLKIVNTYLEEHKTEVEVVAGFLTLFFIPALVAVGVQMALNLATSIGNATISLVMFGVEGWTAIYMLMAKIVQLGIASAAFIFHTAVTIAQTAATIAATAATWLLNAAMIVLTAPIWLVIAAIVALIAIGYLLIKNWDEVKAFGKAMLDFIVAKFWEFVETLKNIGGKIFNAIKQPFEDAWNTISGIVKKIKDALDFTKRQSPSVVDIVNKGVNEVNKAMNGLEFNTSITPRVAAMSVSNAGQGSMVNRINIELPNAVIGSEFEATAMGERIGDAIIKKLQLNVRF